MGVKGGTPLAMNVEYGFLARDTPPSVDSFIYRVRLIDAVRYLNKESLRRGWRGEPHLQ